MIRAPLFAALLLCVSGGYAQDTIAPNANLKTEGIPPIPSSIATQAAMYNDFRGFSFVQWHPRERSMLVRHRAAGANVAQLYLLRSPAGPLEKMTDFPDPVSSAAFEPNQGEYLVIARDSGGNEATAVYRMDLGASKTTLLSQPDERTHFTWTRKGDRLLLGAVPLDKTAGPEKRDSVTTTLTYVDPLKPESKSRLAVLPGGGWEALHFSPDDSTIAALQYRTPNDSEVVLIDARTGQRTKVLPKEGQVPAGYSGFAWSKDNQRLFLTTNQGGEFSELAVYDLGKKHLTVLSRHIPWDIENFSLSEDGTRLFAVANANGVYEVHLFDALSGKELPRPAHQPGAIGGGQWHRQLASEFAFSLNSPQSAGDVYSHDAASGKTQRWTTAEVPLGVDPSTFVTPELVQIKSFDGLPISAWLYLPDARKFPGKRPVRVDFHGGPESQATVRFLGRSNYFLNELGIALLQPNVRGSRGYGKTFLDLDNGFKRKDSVKDGGAFLQWIGSHPRLDKDRIVVAGGSYGGYMSLATAVDYSALIRGSIDVVGISNFVTFLNNTESYRRDLRRVEYGDERDPAMRAFHEQISPLNHAANIRKPLLVVQGKNDPRVPYTEAEQMVAAVRKNNVPVWYLLADNEGHGFRRKANSDFEFFSTVKFLESNLLP
jgi:dipeptidyl aminopeptidase/acylaminoacyl peptidase